MTGLRQGELACAGATSIGRRGWYVSAAATHAAAGGRGRSANTADDDTYGTLMAAAGTPLRTLQGWMGHRDYKTTEIYADFAPDPTQGAMRAPRAFGAASDALDGTDEPSRLF